MMYEITTYPTCTCTATVCQCFNQGGTQSTTIVSESCPAISGNQFVVWVVVRGRDAYEEPDLKIEPAAIRECEPPPRYERRPRPRFRFSPLRLTGKTEVHRSGRERGHAIGHSPRRRAKQ